MKRRTKKFLSYLFKGSSPDSIGRKGESLIGRSLKASDRRGRKGKILRNVFVPMDNGKTTEIDLLFITRKGIFVIESKNYSGWIFGSEDGLQWTSTLYAGKDWLGRKQTEKHQFYNPIRQNAMHIKHLKRCLNQDVKIISLIVFSDRCELKDVPLSSGDTYICKRGSVKHLIKQYWKYEDDVFTDEQVEAIYERLRPLLDTDGSKKQRHVEKVVQRFTNADTCPVCGRALVVRTAKRGPNAGRQFLGCSGWPVCTYTRNI